MGLYRGEYRNPKSGVWHTVTYDALKDCVGDNLPQSITNVMCDDGIQRTALILLKRNRQGHMRARIRVSFGRIRRTVAGIVVSTGYGLAFVASPMGKNATVLAQEATPLSAPGGEYRMGDPEYAIFDVEWRRE